MNCLSWILPVRKRVILSFLACFLISIVFLGSDNAVAHSLVTTSNGNIYPTQGVHNDKGCDESTNSCLPTRNPGDPSDPQYPKWWISDWTMYRIFQNYEDNQFPPPYDSPPENLTDKVDYEKSYGTTYYDSTYKPQDGDGTGAMMEHYKEQCLPIFPQDNQYTCSFVSLGNKAYFLRYDDKKPNQKPIICLFSPQNHPPETDFIKHLPYNSTESTHVNNSLQAYSIRVPERGQKILFGYAFDKNPTPDSFDKTAEPYRHPQSFYFSGERQNPPNAPMVSQNYTNFRMEKPNSKIWSEVAEMVPPNPEACCLFDSKCPGSNLSKTLQPTS